jgi:hypothetical protein
VLVEQHLQQTAEVDAKRSRTPKTRALGLVASHHESVTSEPAQQQQTERCEARP